ncbi:hypothetical protein ACG7TL_008084 [Trametes sanguinea]
MGQTDDTLPQVYLPAIDGLVPPEIVKTIRAFLEFCYLVRRDVHTQESLGQLSQALSRFRQHREFFRASGVHAEGFSLPHQHSVEHYLDRIWEFDAPNGLCSSITESKHIKAVKEPWRRSNRYDALDQMLMTNQRLDKLAASRVDFTECGMLMDDCLAAARSALGEGFDRPGLTGAAWRKEAQPTPRLESHEDEDGKAVDGPRVMAYMTMATTTHSQHGKTADRIGAEFSIPSLSDLIRRFLYYELGPSCSEAAAHSGATLPLDLCPPFSDGAISVHYSATATFYAPSGVSGMRREIIRANPLWRGRPARFDCILINKSDQHHGLLGMEVAQVRLFFSFRYRHRRYHCAAVHWFDKVAEGPDEDTGMWIVRPAIRRGRPILLVINLTSIVRAAHLIGHSGADKVPEDLESQDALAFFETFHVNNGFQISTPAPKINGEAMLEVFIHRSMKFSGAPLSSDSPHGDGAQPAALESKVLEAVYTDVLFNQRPMLLADEIRVMCIIFSIGKGRKALLRWSDFVKAMQSLGFEIAPYQNGRKGNGSRRVFTPPASLRDKPAASFTWDEPHGQQKSKGRFDRKAASRLGGLLAQKYGWDASTFFVQQ